LLEFKEIITYIFAVGSAQAVFLFFILWKKEENQFANKFLAFCMLAFAFDLLAGVAFLTGYIERIPWVLGLNNSFPYLYGPLIYLYVVFLIHKKEYLNRKYLLHFIPFVLVHIYGSFFFYFESPEYQLSMLDFATQTPWHIELIGLLIPFSGITYMILTVLESIRYNRKIRNSLSSIENIDLSWLLYLVFGTVVIWLVVAASYLVGFIYGEQLQANLMIYIVLSIFLYSLAFKSYKQPQIKTIEEETTPYRKSGLAEQKAEEYLQKLTETMKEEKPFLDPRLSLSQLADIIGITAHNLSEIINVKQNQNFYDFVNSYRVKEVKNLILEDREGKYNLLAHGFEAGFSSKSAFYSAFKKNTGKTPAQFRKEAVS
jgi:AraC-like DNA-binding protein